MIADAVADLEAACRTVEGIRVFQLGDTIDPPAAVVGPPRLLWEVQCVDGGPTSAEFLVLVAVAFDDRAIAQLYEVVPRVVLAIETETPGAVSEANPSTYNNGSTSLPGYELRVSYPLQ
jgi:hypothetical protein